MARSSHAASTSDLVPVTVGRDGSLLFRFADIIEPSETVEAQNQRDVATLADYSTATTSSQPSDRSASGNPEIINATSHPNSSLPLTIREAQTMSNRASRPLETEPANSLPATNVSSSDRDGLDESDRVDAEAAVSLPEAPGAPPPLPTSQQQFYERQRLQADQRQQQRMRGLEPSPDMGVGDVSTQHADVAMVSKDAAMIQKADRQSGPTASHAAAMAAVRSLQSQVANHTSLTGAGRERVNQASHDAAQIAAGHALLQSRGLSAASSDAISLLESFSDLAEKGKLKQALSVVAAFRAAQRRDVLPRLLQRHFLKSANKRRDVDAALQFVQLLPQNVVDVRTYTMLIGVCVAARDAAAALSVADSWREMGRKLDTKMYTSVITACAEAGDADAATLEYQRMRAEGCKVDRHVYSALISAFNEAVRQRRGTAERRADLVLLERAFNLVDDMREADLEPDVVVYNTLVSLAGQAGQLQRAMDTVTEMEMRRCPPDEYTYASLIDACGRSGQPDEARKVYDKAMSKHVATGPALYSAAISACRAGSTADAEHAMNIYRDMLREGVQPDPRLYCSLMSVAGAANDTTLAFSLLDDMTDEGVRQCSGTLSTLVVVSVLNDDVDRAYAVYKTMRARMVVPTPKAFNALVGAMGKAYRLGGVADVLADMTASGCVADGFTYSAVLNSCQRAQEPDLAFDIYRLMQSQGIRIGASHAFSLVRICFNTIRSMWFPSGHPTSSSEPRPNLPGSRRSREGTALLAALGGSPSSPAESPSDVAGWQTRALKVYKDALQGGPPSLRLLDRLLGCLREPLPSPSAVKEDKSWQKSSSSTASSSNSRNRSRPRRLPTQRKSAANSSLLSDSKTALGSAWQVRARYVGAQHQAGTPHIQMEGVWGRMQDKAVALVEEAVSLQVLPGYSLTDSLTVDFRSLPPNVAESYALAILSSLYRRKQSRRWEKVDHAIAFLVPFFDSHDILQRSDDHSRAIHSSRQDQQRQQKQSRPSSSDQDDNFQAGEATALGVAAAVKRLKVHAAMDAKNGAIMMQPQELTRWVRATARAEANLKGAPSKGIWEGVQLRSTPIARQAADIRMRGKNGYAARRSQPSWQSVLQHGNTANSAVDNWWEEPSTQPDGDSQQQFHG